MELLLDFLEVECLLIGDFFALVGGPPDCFRAVGGRLIAGEGSVRSGGRNAVAEKAIGPEGHDGGAERIVWI